MTTKPRRRWMSFSLRTMLIVVTLFALWLGWKGNFVRQRVALIRSAREGNREPYVWVLLPTDFSSGSYEEKLPRWRRLLGDHTVVVVHFHPECSLAEIKDVMKLFPEASFWIGDHIQITPEVLAWLEAREAQHKAPAANQPSANP